MVTKRTPYMLCMSLLMLSTLAYQSHAMQSMPLITATECWSACKKLAKTAATAGIGYWLIRRIIKHKISHTDTTTYPPTARSLSVITDGKVTIRRSADRQTRVTHCYAALWGSHLPSLHFSENFDGEKLEIHGHTTPTRRHFLAKILEFLFYLKPKKILHHIIEVPDSMAIDVTTTNSSLYSHRNSFVVTIESLKNAISIHAYTGNVHVISPKKYARPADTETHTASSAKDKDTGTASSHQSKWVRKQAPCKLPPAINIHTPDTVVVENFQGDLYIFDDGQQIPGHQQQIDLTRHSDNHYGIVRINNSEQPFSLHYSSQQRAQIHQHATATAVTP